MTTTNNKPLTATQQRNLERLIHEEFSKVNTELHHHFQRRYDTVRKETREAILDELGLGAASKKWLQAVAAFRKKVDAINEDLPEGVTLSATYFPPERVPYALSREQEKRITDAVSAVHTEQARANEKSYEAHQKAIRQVLLATLGDAEAMLSNLTPSLSDFLS